MHLAGTRLLALCRLRDATQPREWFANAADTRQIGSDVDS